jgi:transcriptional pleiotropic repressor
MKVDSELVTKIKRLNAQTDVRSWAKNVLSDSLPENDFPLNDLSVALGDILDANIYIVTNEGQLHGFYERYRVNPGRIRNMVEKRTLPYNYMKRLDGIEETIINIDIHNDLTIFPVEKRSLYPSALTTLVPVELTGERVGMLIIGRVEVPLDANDCLFAEHAASMIGIELAFEYTKKEVEIEQKKRNAKLALSALSTSEMNALRGIFDEMGDEIEMRVTASDIADKLDITRSIVVNSLRKLVTASVIDQRSMGMKGTYIKILNPYFIELLYQSAT